MNPKEINWAGYPPQFLKGLTQLVVLSRVSPGFEGEVVSEILQILERYEDGGEVSIEEDRRVFDATLLTLEEIYRALTSYKVTYLKGSDY